jgi:hypothetical protein
MEAKAFEQYVNELSKNNGFLEKSDLDNKEAIREFNAFLLRKIGDHLPVINTTGGGFDLVEHGNQIIVPINYSTIIINVDYQKFGIAVAEIAAIGYAKE